MRRTSSHAGRQVKVFRETIFHHLNNSLLPYNRQVNYLGNVNPFNMYICLQVVYSSRGKHLYRELTGGDLNSSYLKIFTHENMNNHYFASIEWLNCTLEKYTQSVTTFYSPSLISTPRLEYTPAFSNTLSPHTHTQTQS